MSIRAIETEYNRYKFRSRLEARWAVFFDAAGIPYDYEQQGYDLKSCWYLPDFFLPSFNCYVEIKPKFTPQMSQAMCKLQGMWDDFDTTRNCCLLCVGDPVDSQMYLYCGLIHRRDQTYTVEWMNPMDHKVGFYKGVKFYQNEYPRDHVMLGFKKRDGGRPFVPNVKNMSSCMGYASSLQDQKTLARQARFEHGETPNVRRLP